MATKAKNASGGGNADGSGGTGGNGSDGKQSGKQTDDNSDDDDAGDDGDNPPKKIPYDTYQRTVTESKNRLKRLQEIEAENQRLKDEKTAREKEALESQGQFKTLLEQEREAHKATVAKLTQKDTEIKTFKERDLDRKKFVALNKALGASIAPEYHPLIDWEQMGGDIETGEIDETSIANYAQTFKTKYPAILSTGQGTGLPNTKPGAGKPGGSAKITFADWEKLPSKEAKKYKPEDIIG